MEVGVLKRPLLPPSQVRQRSITVKSEKCLEPVATAVLSQARQRKHHLSETAAVDIQRETDHIPTGTIHQRCSIPNLLNEDGYVKTADCFINYPDSLSESESESSDVNVQTTSPAVQGVPTTILPSGSSISLTPSSSEESDYHEIGLVKPHRISSDDFCTQVQDLVQNVESSELTYEEFFAKVKVLVDLVDDYTCINDWGHHEYEHVKQKTERFSDEQYIEIVVSDFNQFPNIKDPNLSFLPPTNSTSSYSESKLSRSLPSLIDKSAPKGSTSDSKCTEDKDGYTVIKPTSSTFNLLNDPQQGCTQPPLPPRRKRSSDSPNTLPNRMLQQTLGRDLPEVPPRPCHTFSNSDLLTKHTPPRVQRRSPLSDKAEDSVSSSPSISFVGNSSPPPPPPRVYSHSHSWDINTTPKPFTPAVAPSSLQLAPTSTQTKAGLTSSTSEDDFMNVADVLREHRMLQNHLYKSRMATEMNSEVVGKSMTSPVSFGPSSLCSPQDSTTMLYTKQLSTVNSRGSLHRSLSLTSLNSSDGCRGLAKQSAVIGYVEPLYAAPLNAGYRSLQLGNAQPTVQSATYEGWLQPGTTGKNKKVSWKRKLYCCLEAGELFMYTSKRHQLQHLKPHRVLKLSGFCQLAKLSDDEIRMCTLEETVHLKADNKLECTNWVAALSQMMESAEVPHSESRGSAIVEGSLTAVVHGTSYKCFGSLETGQLLLYNSSQKERLLFTFTLQNYKVVLDSTNSSTERSSPKADSPKESCAPICLKEEDGIAVRLLVEACCHQKWHFFLSGESTPSALGHNPLHSSHSGSDVECLTHKSVEVPFTFLPTQALISLAKTMFEQIQTYTSTSIENTSEKELWYFVVYLQSLLEKCMVHQELQGEFYSQLISLISQHNSENKLKTLQGWQLMAIAIPLFLPNNPRQIWHMEKFIHKNLKCRSEEVEAFAACCQQRLERAQKNSRRLKGPSSCELMAQIMEFPRPPLEPLTKPVYISNGDVITIQYDPSSTVQEVSVQINQELGMPPSSETGFSLSCDWPGLESYSEIQLHPLEKICDVISHWKSCLASQNMSKTREIRLGYKKRDFLRSRIGFESEKEALLLIHQINQYVVNTQYKVNMETAFELAALMLQIVNGPCSLFTQPQRASLLEDSIASYLPIVLVRDSVLLSGSHMKEKILSQWQQLQSWRTSTCLSRYLDKVRCIPLFGHHQFECLQKIPSEGSMPVTLAVGEDGVRILNKSHSETRFCSYQTIKSFGKSGEDFMLYFCNKNITTCEKMIFCLPEVLLQEISLLIATYIDAYLTHSPRR